MDPILTLCTPSAGAKFVVTSLLLQDVRDAKLQVCRMSHDSRFHFPLQVNEASTLADVRQSIQDDESQLQESVPALTWLCFGL